MKLYVKCPECNAIVFTGIKMNEDSFKSAVIKDNVTNCNNCGAIINFSKEDIVDEEGKPYEI